MLELAINAPLCHPHPNLRADPSDRTRAVRFQPDPDSAINITSTIYIYFSSIYNIAKGQLSVHPVLLRLSLEVGGEPRQYTLISTTRLRLSTFLACLPQHRKTITMPFHSPRHIALILAPFTLAGASGSLPPVERHVRHRDLAARLPSLSLNARQASTSSIPLGGFREVGDSGVSAQMMFLGSAETVFILDSKSKSLSPDDRPDHRGRNRKQQSYRHHAQR